MSAPVVHLVGAGPGDRGSLTRRAAGLLAAAEVVVLDRPSLDDVAALAPVDAERVHVGLVRGGSAGWSTAEVVALLVDRARRGLRVVRLKGGDPYLCSRGAEEALALAATGITVDVCPGVTAATAAAAASGLDRGPAVTIASGQHDPIGPEVEWAALQQATSGGAVLVLTGRAHQAQVAAGLLQGGRRADAPAAVVHGAGRSDQSVAATTVDQLGSIRLAPPATLVVGGTRREGANRAHP